MHRREYSVMRWHQLALAGVLAAVASVVIGAPIGSAGGWAITTLDELPTVIRAGETYAIGYTIRQHGQTPFSTAQSAIEIRRPRGGTAERFVGTREGAPGHYVVEVRFREAGDWEWSADQSPFARQPLGTISVVPGAVTTEPEPTAPLENAAAKALFQLAVAPGARLGLPIASVLALAVFAWRLLLLFRTAPASAAQQHAAGMR
jgi:hypothetical protein